ncbi:MAG: MucB/RseB C-terminal domain-containing protein [Thauera sp.]|jgi:sigma-E factor negative regulatory protein RseB|nr:MucB/RseB C-terminal domain-containing protein [Thauera sp.]
MKRLGLVLGFCLAVLHGGAMAEVPSDPLAWLGRIANAGQRLNYVGTFVYQSGSSVETSRITHKVEGGQEFERLESLDGSPREVIREGMLVRCLLPEQRVVIHDEVSGRRVFPGRLPLAPMALAENYRIRKGELARVAGMEVQTLVLEPRDDLRYGHTLWAERETGLLLKARTTDHNDRLIDQFSFSEVRIGGEIDPALLASRFSDTEDWRQLDARGQRLGKADSGWLIDENLSGYVLTSVMRRHLGAGREQTLHLVFSDGLVSVSVFIEPVIEDGAAGLGPLASGSFNVFKRVLDGHLITVLGEVPEAAVRRIGEALRPGGG